MADGSASPGDVVPYDRIRRDRAECAFGSRSVAGGSVVGYPRLKLVVHRIVNVGIRLLVGLRYTDVTNACTGHRADVIAGCRPFLSPHVDLTVELPREAVVPIVWLVRLLMRGDHHRRDEQPSAATPGPLVHATDLRP